MVPHLKYNESRYHALPNTHSQKGVMLELFHLGVRGDRAVLEGRKDVWQAV